jgi:3-keto-5-aminohexanoate cleavage enzyme
MAIEDPVIITCAISGVLANRQQCPAIPYTPQEYAQEAARAAAEGAAMIHIHARKPDGQPSFEVEDYEAIAQAIRQAAPELIINFSTGAVGVPVPKRLAYLRACRPEVAALNMGSMNYAKYSSRRREFVFEMVFANPFAEIRELLEAMGELQIKPEHECFDIGHVASIPPLQELGLVGERPHVNLIFGVLGGIPASARNLEAMVDNLPEGAHWSVIAISRHQWLMVAAALAAGGSVRVGLEDNLYLPDGQMARSNGDLIAQARRMTEAVGRPVATPEQARALLGIARAG